MIPGNKLYFIPSDSKFVFGVLTSQAHNAWMRMVSGRLKADYNYGNTIVYNNFVGPTVNEKQKVEIERLAQTILDACAQYPGSSLADLYDPDNAFLYPELVAAHEALDRAVERLYGFGPSRSRRSGARGADCGSLVYPVPGEGCHGRGAGDQGWEEVGEEAYEVEDSSGVSSGWEAYGRFMWGSSGASFGIDCF